MKITVLLENTTCAGTIAAHGLSLCIETEKHKLLFDAGPDGNLLLQNAETLGIDLGKVDIAALSHGHYDHSGGLMAFLNANGTAPVYMQKLAPVPHYATENVGFRYIGIDKDISEKFADRLIFTEGVYTIDDELTLFSDIETADFLSDSNLSLLEPDGDSYIPDRFLHEQNLLINQNGKAILIAGCAHRGIVNILRRACEILGKAPDAVYAGFHLTNPGRGIDEPDDFVASVALALSKYPSRFYTGHCTGTHPFSVLKETLGDRLTYMAGGKIFEE